MDMARSASAEETPRRPVGASRTCGVAVGHPSEPCRDAGCERDIEQYIRAALPHLPCAHNHPRPPDSQPPEPPPRVRRPQLFGACICMERVCVGKTRSETIRPHLISSHELSSRQHRCICITYRNPCHVTLCHVRSCLVQSTASTSRGYDSLDSTHARNQPAHPAMQSAGASARICMLLLLLLWLQECDSVSSFLFFFPPSVFLVGGGETGRQGDRETGRAVRPPDPGHLWRVVIYIF